MFRKDKEIEIEMAMIRIDNNSKSICTTNNARDNAKEDA